MLTGKNIGNVMMNHYIVKLKRLMRSENASERRMTFQIKGVAKKYVLQYNDHNYATIHNEDQ
jgi:hypothetical protein